MTSSDVQVSAPRGRRAEPSGSTDLARLASIVVGIGFAIGLFYNVGFFLCLDLRLFPLLTYKDHLETLVFFGPIALVPTFWCVGVRSVAERMRLASKAAITLSVLTIAVWGEQLATRSSFATPVVIAGAAAAFVLVAYCGAVLLDRGLPIQIKDDDTSPERASLAFWTAAMGLLVFVTMLGGATALLVLRSTTFDTQLILTPIDGEKPSPPQTVRLIRVIDNGALVVFSQAPKRIAFVRNEGFRMLSDPASP